ncbi:MAG: L-aspartate oxidase [Flavobacteriia bacterium]|nr:L-aspartate oxidase [Flavobacteriia bacterium]
MEKIDVIVVGSGIAGLSFSIYLAQKRTDISIVVYTKSEQTESNTRYAQGGIAGVLNMKEDSFQAHIDDTLEAGGFECDEYIVEKIIKSAPDRILELESWGVNFTKDKNGKKEAALEGGHTFPRVVHAKDSTGNEIENALIQKMKEYSNIQIFNHYQVLDLIVSNNQTNGVEVLNTRTKIIKLVKSNAVVLSTGGCGQLFKFTTNPSIATGDGIVLASKVGAKIKGMNYIQFHPTAFYENNKSPLFLISEAVRGAGAYLINSKEERFVFQMDCRGELATRDIVTKAILNELKTQKTAHVYLDCRHLDFLDFKHSFPMITAYCESKGIDIRKDCIPVVPAAHYQCGGIEVNEFGETAVQNLYALGECSNTGMHGKNRLASNSLLEAVAFGYFASNDIAKKNFRLHNLTLNETILNVDIELNSQNKIISEIQNIMYNHAMIGSDIKTINEGIQKLNTLKLDQHCNDTFSLNLWKLQNAICLSNIILEQMKSDLEIKSNNPTNFQNITNLSDSVTHSSVTDTHVSLTDIHSSVTKVLEVTVSVQPQTFKQ